MMNEKSHIYTHTHTHAHILKQHNMNKTDLCASRNIIGEMKALANMKMHY